MWVNTRLPRTKSRSNWAISLWATQAKVWPELLFFLKGFFKKISINNLSTLKIGIMFFDFKIFNEKILNFPNFEFWTIFWNSTVRMVLMALSEWKWTQKQDMLRWEDSSAVSTLETSGKTGQGWDNRPGQKLSRTSSTGWYKVSEKCRQLRYGLWDSHLTARSNHWVSQG